MGELDGFSARLMERLKRERDERERRKLQINAEMVRFLEKKKRFYEDARDILTSVIYPRLEELSGHFDNSKLGDIRQTDELYCSCEFSHSSRFPAATSIEFILSPGEDYESLDIDYHLKIHPIFMDFPANDKMNFPLESRRKGLTGWVESKLLEFVDIYLKLETHPLYQRESVAVDPVCGMLVHVYEAAATVESDGITTYFCSEACKSEFLKGDKRRKSLP